MKNHKNNIYAITAMREGFASYPNMAFSKAHTHSLSLNIWERSKTGFISVGIIPAHWNSTMP
jgi:hypothetical protein